MRTFKEPTIPSPDQGIPDQEWGDHTRANHSPLVINHVPNGLLLLNRRKVFWMVIQIKKITIGILFIYCRILLISTL